MAVKAVLQNRAGFRASVSGPYAQAGSGIPGEDGATFIPAVSPEGTISWSNDRGLPNPEPVNIRGPKGDDGSPGIQGPRGDPGYTPQKGTDYWTAADIAEIKSYVEDAILGGEW